MTNKINKLKNQVNYWSYLWSVMVNQTTKSEGFGVIVQKEDNAIQRMNCYQVKKCKENLSTRKRFTQWIELSILQTNCAGQKVFWSSVALHYRNQNPNFWGSILYKGLRIFLCSILVIDWITTLLNTCNIRQHWMKSSKLIEPLSQRSNFVIRIVYILSDNLYPFKKNKKIKMITHH